MILSYFHSIISPRLCSVKYGLKRVKAVQHIKVTEDVLGVMADKELYCKVAEKCLQLEPKTEFIDYAICLSNQQHCFF